MKGYFKEIDVQALLNEQLKDPEFKEGYERVKATYDLIEQIINIRRAKGMTQSELAIKAHLSQQAISRLEKEKHLPNTKTLLNVLNALGVSVQLVEHN